MNRKRLHNCSSLLVFHLAGIPRSPKSIKKINYNDRILRDDLFYYVGGIGSVFLVQ